MSRLLKNAILSVVVFLAAIPCLAQSADKPADKYKESGNVLSVVSKHGHFYQVATDSRIYLLMCAKVGFFGGAPECKAGDKPIATGDALHFRIDGDWVYVPLAAAGSEDKLRILTTELKVIPPLPAPASTSGGKSAAPAAERGIVIGTGLHVKGQSGVGWSTTPSAVAITVAPSIATASATTPVMATGPVIAVPVTGGAPVAVVPVGPTTGGMVTGVPVTGGAPITAIPTAPVMGVPVGGAPAGGGPVMMGGGSKPRWVHVLRIQTAGKIYQLECSGKPCALANKEIGLGDTLNLRTEKKRAYLSADSQNGAGQQFKILAVTDSGSVPDSKQR